MVYTGRACRRQNKFVIQDRPAQHAWPQPPRCRWFIKTPQGLPGGEHSRGELRLFRVPVPRGCQASCSLWLPDSWRLCTWSPLRALERLCLGHFQRLLVAPGDAELCQVASDSPHSPSFSDPSYLPHRLLCVTGVRWKGSCHSFPSSLMRERFCCCGWGFTGWVAVFLPVVLQVAWPYIDICHHFGHGQRLFLICCSLSFVPLSFPTRSFPVCHHSIWTFLSFWLFSCVVYSVLAPLILVFFKDLLYLFIFLVTSFLSVYTRSKRYLKDLILESPRFFVMEACQMQCDDHIYHIGMVDPVSHVVWGVGIYP